MILAVTDAASSDHIAAAPPPTATRPVTQSDVDFLPPDDLVQQRVDNTASASSPCFQQPGGKRTKLTVADVLRRYWPDYLKRHRATLDPHIIYMMSQFTSCRTEQLGATVWRCLECQHEHIFYHSCGHRQCPTCGANRRKEWLEKALSESLPVPYVHLVITLPHDFNELARTNPKRAYELLLVTTRMAIQRLASKLGFIPGAVMILHTWGQQCLLHIHCHVLLAAGGPSLDGTRWVHVSDPNHMFHRETLMTTFRDLFCDGLEKLYTKGQLDLSTLSSEAASSLEGFQAWLKPLRDKRWIVNQQGPPQAHFTSEAAVRYLARYIQGTAISDKRLVLDDGYYVSFTIKDYRNGGQRVAITIPGEEFIERFLLHLLPKGFRRIRHFGFIAVRRKKTMLDHCRELLGVPTEEAEQPSDNSPSTSTGDSPTTSTGDGNVDGDQHIEAAEEAEEFEGWCPKCKKRGTLQWRAEIPATKGWQRHQSLIPAAARRRLHRAAAEDHFNSGIPP